MAIGDDVLEKAERMAGKMMTSPDVTMLTDCCAAAVDELSKRLRDGVEAQDVQSFFVRAAACLAVASYLEADTRRIEGFSAAGVRTAGRSPGHTRSQAESLRRQAELMMLGYIKDRGFCFKAVTG